MQQESTVPIKQSSTPDPISPANPSPPRQKRLKLLLIIFVLLPLVLVNGYLIGKVAQYAFVYIGEQTGLIQDFSYISGTGSMYPTFPKGRGETTIEQIEETVGGVNARKYPGGITLFGTTHFSYELAHDDIIFFANPKTREIIEAESSGAADLSYGFVKRIIGLPGDLLEIRDGFVWRNKERIEEPYTASPRSTYGGEFLPDCHAYRVPDDHVFVMGDNRKESNDSRFDLGVVATDDIHSVIAASEQEHLKRNWRDTSFDHQFANLPTLDASTYVSLLNTRRQAEGLAPLTLNEQLSASAKLRADVILTHNDLSFEATKSGFTMRHALDQVGYNNIVWGEAPMLGYFTAEELIDNSFAFPESQAFLLHPDFQDIGISVHVGSLNACPTQVIVQHFGGFVPAVYADDVIAGWQEVLDRLREIQPTWNEIKTFDAFYLSHQEDTDRIIEIIALRIDRISSIVEDMRAGVWLSADDQAYLQEDAVLFEEQERLAKKLNEEN